MDSRTIEKVNNLLKLMQEDTVTPAVLERFIADILQVLLKVKKETENLNTETKATAEKLLTFTLDNYSEAVNKLKEEGKREIDRIDKKINLANKTYQDAEQFLEEVKSIKVQIPKDGKDGKDADEGKIIKEVLSRLPEVKDGKDGSPDKPEEIVAKLESLKGNKRLSASAIKGLDEIILGLRYEIQSKRSGTYTNLRVKDEGVGVTDEGISSINFTGSGVEVTRTGEGAVTVNVTATGGGSSVTFSDVQATNSGDDINFTLSSTPVSGSLLLYNQNTGQAYTNNADYTISGTNITFTTAQTGVTVRAKYATASSGITFVDEQATTSDDINYTISQVPTSGSLTVYNQNTGQIYTNAIDYTLSSTTITFTTAQTGVTIRTKYVY